MILAAGLGTRLRQLTEQHPKALVEVGGSPMLHNVITRLVESGYKHIVVNVHHFGQQVIDYIESHNYDAIIEISDERELLMDTGGGILKAMPLLADSDMVLVHNVDIMSDIDLYAIGQAFVSSDDDAWLLTQERPSSRKLLFDAQDYLVGWRHATENRYKWVKQSMEHYQEYSFSGIHFFKPKLFAQINPTPCSIIDLYLRQATTYKIRKYHIEPTTWFDLGKPETIYEAERLFISKRQNTKKQ